MKKYHLTIDNIVDFLAKFNGLERINVSEKEAAYIVKIGDDKRFMLIFLSLLEVLFSVLIIGCLCVIAIPSYRNDIAKARNGSMLAEISQLKIDASIYYAEYGVWPPSFVDKSTDYSDYKSVQLTTEGQIIVIKKEDAQPLTVTPFISKNADGSENDMVLWLCGYAKPPSSYSTTAIHYLTTIPPAQLPRICVD